MNIDLSGKTALVTGSTQGIGFATARGLARSGAHVIVNGRGEASVVKALESLRAAVPAASFTGVAADLSTDEGYAALRAEVPTVDVLVNNVGVFEITDFFEIDDAAWRRFFDTNVLSGARLARALVPAMVDRGWGRVIFIASESALDVPPDAIHYGMTKAAVLAVSRGLAKRLAGTNVTVNAVLPGPTLTGAKERVLAAGMQANGQSLEQAAAQFVRQHRPSSILRRPSTVDEVANMVVYAASPQASATTGAALRVDGGVIDSL